MLRSLIAAAIALACFTSSADARAKRATGMHPECNVSMPCTPPASAAQVREGERQARGKYISRQLGIGGVAPRPLQRGKSSSGLVPKLAAKVAQISQACGSTVISAVRHTRIAGSRRMSQHSNGTAVDMQGNPSCIYAQLQGWPGGYSIDYGRVRHVHISIGGPEAGLRFNHGTSRYARRHNRYARAR